MVRGKKVQMSDSEGTQTAVQLNKGLLLASALLIGGASVMGATGVLLAGAALISATRQWVQQLERPPADVARSKWQQVRAAGNAAASAWQNQPDGVNS
jgi:hypothetical protein